MRPGDHPPRGLQWTIAPAGRLLSFFLAVAALSVSMYVGYRYVGLVDCLREKDLADQRRTSAIAAASTNERAADLALIKGAPNDFQRNELRKFAIAARENTDRVRAAHPAPEVKACN